MTRQTEITSPCVTEADYQYLIRFWIHRYGSEIGAANVEDIVVSAIGKAWERYDPTHASGASLRTYVFSFVRGELTAFFRHRVREQAVGCGFTDEDTGPSLLNVSDKAVAVACGPSAHNYVTKVEVSDEVERRIMNQLSAVPPENLYYTIQTLLSDDVASAQSKGKEKRTAMTMRYCLGYTLDDIKERLGAKSKQSVQQLIKSGVEDMRRTVSIKFYREVFTRLVGNGTDLSYENIDEVYE